MPEVMMYPIFFDCCNFIDDIFWKSIFEELSYGRCPYGTYINKDFFCCNFKGKEFSYNIHASDDSYTVYMDVYDLLRSRLGLMSNSDKVAKRDKFIECEKSLKDEQYCNWNDIKKKNVKKFLVDDYIIRNKKKYTLNNKQCSHIMTVILLGLLFKTLVIDCDDGRILSIEGIEFSDKNVQIDKKLLKNHDTHTAPAIILEKPHLSNEWRKYVNNIKSLKKGLYI
tara:strand:+ start:36 stop:707 length:672 start_codon:yes stop_codon:yes gene_type:complete